jgi:hypothetical protein
LAAGTSIYCGNNLEKKLTTVLWKLRYCFVFDVGIYFLIHKGLDFVTKLLNQPEKLDLVCFLLFPVFGKSFEAQKLFKPVNSDPP